MRILWKYLEPHKGLIAGSLLSAPLAQLLSLINLLLFGKIIGDFTTGRGQCPRYPDT
jgi:ATP-binding cassette subfamily B protein